MKYLKASEILGMLTEMINDSEIVESQRTSQYVMDMPQNPAYNMTNILYRYAPVRELIIALQASTIVSHRLILCQVLGTLHARSAIPILIDCLSNSDTAIQSAAADALASIGDIRAGSALLDCFAASTTKAEVRRMLAVALGAVGYRTAIPVLRQALSSTDASLRGSAAWSLGKLHASEARDSLQYALEHETEAYPKQQLQLACNIVRD